MPHGSLAERAASIRNQLQLSSVVIETRPQSHQTPAVPVTGSVLKWPQVPTISPNTCQASCPGSLEPPSCSRSRCQTRCSVTICRRVFLTGLSFPSTPGAMTSRSDPDDKPGDTIAITQSDRWLGALPRHVPLADCADRTCVEPSPAQYAEGPLLVQRIMSAMEEPCWVRSGTELQ